MAPKKKQEKMNLGEFLTNQSLGSWADEMETQPIPVVPATYGARDRDMGERRAFTQPSWENARAGGSSFEPRGASYDRPFHSEREQLPLPTKPPYTAHLGNLAYDVTQGDVEDFLKECQVTNVRIVEDKVDHKPKGFGYVEFGTLDGLKKALTYSETNFMGRNVKISVAEPPRDRGESTRDLSDWSRKGPLPELPQNTRQPSNRGFGRNFDNMSDAGSELGGGRRPGFFENDGKVRDFSTWERKGPLSPVPTAGPPVRDGGRLRDTNASTDRRQSPAWGEGASDAGARPPRKEFEPRPPQPERVPTAADMDNQWRARMRPDPSPVVTPAASLRSSPQAEAPKERPKLNLKQRTVSATTQEPASAASSDAKASPFGAARPIDTASREREVEEKRQLAIRQKKEADDKAREEKQAAEAAGKSARAPHGQTQDDVTSPTIDGNKNRRSSRQQNGTKSDNAANVSILRRNGENPADAPGVDAPANGTIVDDNAIKPQETTHEVNKDDSGASPEVATTTAEAQEEAGWSTVGANNKKNNRRGGYRGIAS